MKSESADKMREALSDLEAWAEHKKASHMASAERTPEANEAGSSRPAKLTSPNGHSPRSNKVAYAVVTLTIILLIAEVLLLTVKF